MGMDMRICSIDCLVKEVWFQMSNNCIMEPSSHHIHRNQHFSDCQSTVVGV